MGVGKAPGSLTQQTEEVGDGRLLVLSRAGLSANGEGTVARLSSAELNHLLETQHRGGRISTEISFGL